MTFKPHLGAASMIAAICAVATCTVASAQASAFSIPAGDLESGVIVYVKQSGAELIFRVDDLRGLTTKGVSGLMSNEAALDKLLDGTPVRVRRDGTRAAALYVERPQASALIRAKASNDGPVAAVTESLEAVSIVGSRSKNRTVFDTTAPVDIFRGKELEKALVSGEVGQALQSLSPSINMPRVSSSGTSDAIRSIQLRGLAPDHVLVLVNGKRRHASAVLDQEGLFKGSVPVDLNAIPASAIERIEVLRDGAGAQYGSDAVAGVVNIVLKNAASGGVISLSQGAYRTSFEPTGQTITDGQNTQLSANHGMALGDSGFLRYGAELHRKRGTNRAGIGGDFSDNGTAADEAQVGKVLYKSGDPDVEGGNAFYSAEYGLASDVRLYSYSMVSKREVTGAAFFRWPGDSSNVLSVYPSGYRPDTTSDTRDISVVAGAKGETGGVAWDLSVRHGQNDFYYGVKNSLNSSLGAASPTTFRLADFIAKQTALNVDGSWSTALGANAIPVNIAFGAELMRDAFRSKAGDPGSYAAGNQGGAPGAQAGPGLKPEDAVAVSRNVGAIYIDTESDLTQRLLIGAAARYAHYDSFGSATTGKLSGRYKFTDDVLVRSSVSNSFRVPALAQQSFRFNSLNFDSTGTQLLSTALLPPSDRVARQFGATDLKPEKANNITLGLATKLGRSSTFSLDLYRIRIKDRITRTSDLNSDRVSAYLLSTGRGDIASVGFLTNAVDTTTKGLDLVLTSDFAAAGGTLGLSGALNLNRTRLDSVRKSNAQLSAIDPTLTLFDDKTLFDLTHASPRNKVILGADWTGGGLWSMSTKATRYGAVQVMSFDPTVGPITYGANWSIDLEVKYKLSKQIMISLGGNNIFDKYPARRPSSDDLFGHLPYDYSVPIGFNGAYYYARMDYRF